MYFSFSTSGGTRYNSIISGWRPNLTIQANFRLYKPSPQITEKTLSITLKQIPLRLLPVVLSKIKDYNAEQVKYIYYLAEQNCEVMWSNEYLCTVQSALETNHDFFYETISSLFIQSFLTNSSNFTERIDQILLGKAEGDADKWWEDWRLLQVPWLCTREGTEGHVNLNYSDKPRWVWREKVFDSRVYGFVPS